MCSIRVAGGLTPWFQAEQGVHQGGPFSMKLYVAFNADLLDCLRSSSHGAVLPGPGLNLCCPAYADDISLVALHKRSIQDMLHIYCGYPQSYVALRIQPG